MKRQNLITLIRCCLFFIAFVMLQSSAFAEKPADNIVKADIETTEETVEETVETGDGVITEHRLEYKRSEDGVLKYIALFIDGKLVSEENFNGGPTGDLVYETTIEKDGGGYVKGVTDRGRWQGEVKSFTQEGKISMIENYKNGILHGLHKLYWPNGKLWSSVNYKNGMRDGLYKTYYEDGTLNSEVNYRKGLRNGKAKTFIKPVSLKEPQGLWIEATYRRNQLHGPARSYLEDGTLRSQGSFKHGKEDGILKQYYEDGTLWSTQVYRNGVFLNDEGKPFEGIYKLFYKDGAIASLDEYKGGLKEGVSKSYHPSGWLISEITYKENISVGPVKMYDKDGNLREMNSSETKSEEEKGGRSKIEMSP